MSRYLETLIVPREVFGVAFWLDYDPRSLLSVSFVADRQLNSAANVEGSAALIRAAPQPPLGDVFELSEIKSFIMSGVEVNEICVDVTESWFLALWREMFGPKRLQKFSALYRQDEVYYIDLKNLRKIRR